MTATPERAASPGPSASRVRAFAGRWGVAGSAAAWVIVLGLPRLGRRPLWIDEAYTVGATHDLVTTWRRTGGTMALFYLLEWPLAQISLDRAWLRLPSLLCAAAAVVVVHEIGRMIGGRRMGALAAVFLATSWAVARFSLEARSYTLALLLVALSWLGLVGAVRTSDEIAAGNVVSRRFLPQFGAGSASAGGRRWWWLFVVATLLAPLAHGLAALHFVSQVALLGLRPDRRRWWRACVPMAAGLAVEGVLLFALGAGEVANWIEPLNARQVGAIVRMLVGGYWLIGILAVVAAVLVVVDAWRRRRLPPGEDDAWFGLAPLFWAAGVPLLILGMSLLRPYAEPRYVIGSAPGIALLLAGLLVRVRPAALAAGATVVVTLVLVVDQPAVSRRGPEDWPGVAARITADGDDGDGLVMPAKLRSAFDYAWAEDTARGAGVRPDLVPLSPTDPLSDVKRFYDVAPGGLRARLADSPATRTVWYVDRDDSRRDDVDALIADPAVARRYAVAGEWELTGELYLVRFEPRPAP